MIRPAKEKRDKREKRHRRVRVRVSGTARCPRLCVFRSSQHIYAQLIDDEKGQTLASVSDLDLKKTKGKVNKTAAAKEIGKNIAQTALRKKIKEVIFDRGGYKYHGRVRAVAEGAREGELTF